MKSEAELSDKEWRQMRRQLSKLDFEPVPETPVLLSRSLHGGEPILGEEQNSIKGCEHALLEFDINVNDPKDCIVDGQWPQRSKKVLVINNSTSCVLPSTSVSVSPVVRSLCLPQEEELPPESRCELDDAEIAALEARMAAEQKATRRSIMSAFIDLKAKDARSDALRRMKVYAAHTNDVKNFQNKVEELMEQIARTETQRERWELLLDRFSGFTAKQMRQNRLHWGGRHYLVACFHKWKGIAQQKGAKKRALYRILAQPRKRQQLSSFYCWKESARKSIFQKQLQEQRKQCEHQTVETAKELQLQIQQLQQALDDAKTQAVASQKCRQKLEEDLRLVFLRGVSTMNIEALTAFGSSHKQDFKLYRQEPICSQPGQLHGSMAVEIAEKKPSNKTSASSVNPGAMLQSNEAGSSVLSDSSPIVTEASDSKCLTPINPQASSTAPQHVPSRVNQASNGCFVHSKSPGLRSAEMVQQHELFLPPRDHLVSPSASSFVRPSSAPSPTKWHSSQMSTKDGVKVQSTQSVVATSTSRANGSLRGPSVLPARSPSSSARYRRL